MTDGTSQGLFIVVAIVIFGIFVSLSYTVFGSMGDGLHNLVEDATTSSYEKLTNSNVIYHKDFFEGVKRGSSGNLTPHAYGVSSAVFEQDGKYTILFDLEVTEGTLKAIRGHLHISSDVSLYVDGVQQEYSPRWRTFAAGVLFDDPYTVGDTVSFKLEFTADNYDDPINHSSSFFNISPNVEYINGGHNAYEGDDAVNYHNIKIIKHN